MSASLKQIEEQALALSAEERAKLADALLESLHPTISEKAWNEEIEDRVAEFDRGDISSYSAEDVFSDARRGFLADAGVRHRVR